MILRWGLFLLSSLSFASSAGYNPLTTTTSVFLSSRHDSDQKRDELKEERVLLSVSVSSESEFNDAIADFTTIYLISDLYVNRSLEIFGISSLIFDGNGFKIDGQGLDRCLLIINSTVSINNLFITNGYSPIGGGVLVSDYSRATMTNCSVHDNLAAKNGGGLATFNSSTMTLVNCDIYDNTAMSVGGGILGLGKTFDVYSSRIHDNTAYAYGGGIFFHHDVATVVNSAVYDNIGGYGGGLFNYRAFLAITDTDTYGNYAYVYGGAFYIHRPQRLTFVKSNVYENYAVSRGGGVYIYKNTMSMDSCDIFMNEAGERGGGFYSYYGSSTLTNMTFHHNLAGESGGGLFLYDAGTGELRHCAIHNNTAASDSGGGLLIQTGSLSVIDSDFAQNKAVSGGGLYVTGGSSTEVTISNVVVSKNIGTYGGGLYIFSGSVSFTNSSIFKNQADSPRFYVVPSTTCASTVVGGCFYSSNFPNSYDNDESCDFYVLDSSGNGGGVLDVISFDTEADNNDYLKVGGTKYSGDVGPEGVSLSVGDSLKWRTNDDSTRFGFEICFTDLAMGGGLYIAGGDVTLQQCDISENEATHNGGGFYIDGGSNYLVNVDIYDNTASNEGIEVYFSGGTLDAINLHIDHYDADSLGGSSVQAATCVSDCIEGQSGSCTSFSDSSSCFVNCGCDSCGAGTFSSSSGSTSLTDCESCSAGRYSAVMATSCTICQAGRYATNDTSDTGGGQVTQVFSSATTCNACPAGYFASSPAAVVCQACDAGKHSASGESSCSDCLQGSYSGNGQANCTLCEAGKYSPSKGFQSCLACTSPQTSSAGSDRCDQAIVNFYFINNSTKKCSTPETKCLGGYLLPLVEKNYWIDRSDKKYLSQPYRCPRNTCRGASSRDQNDTYCWTEDGFNHATIKECDPDVLMCTSGATGPLCGGCLKEYYFSSNTLKCKLCSSLSFRLYFFVTVAVVFISVVSISKLRYHYKETVFVKTVEDFFRNGDMYVLFSTYQIIQSITFSLSIRYPEPFSTVIRLMSFLNFDFPSIECSNVGVYDRVYILSAMPIIVGVVSMIIGFMRLVKIKYDEKVLHKVKESTRIKSEHSWVIMFLSYLSLPPILSYQFRALDCFPLQSGKRYLQIDSSINCESPQHTRFVVIDAILIAAYLSVPIIWFILLKSKVHQLFPPDVDSSDLPDRRNMDDSLSFLRFLFAHYRPFMAYWEVFDMFRRIFFVGVIPLLTDSTSIQSCIGLGCAYVSTIIYREMLPFSTEQTNTLAYVANVAIFLIYAGSLLVETRFNQSVNNFAFGSILCLINFSVLVTAFTLCALQMRRTRKVIAKQREKLVQHVEWACDFSAQKFATTFDALEREVIPPSHCAAFYYGSLENINHFLYCGLPVSSEDINIEVHLKGDGRDMHELHKEVASGIENEPRRSAAVHSRREDSISDDKEKLSWKSDSLAHSSTENAGSKVGFNVFGEADEEGAFFDHEDANAKDNKSEGGTISTKSRAIIHKGPETTTPMMTMTKTVKTSSNSSNRQGIIFTTHQPHYLTNADRYHFTCCEAVLVCSLPKAVLKRCDKDCDYLFWLPKSILLAMRGSNFEGLVNPEPWRQGSVLMLPPHCIKRAYQLKKDHQIAARNAATTVGSRPFDSGGGSGTFNARARASTLVDFVASYFQATSPEKAPAARLPSKSVGFNTITSSSSTAAAEAVAGSPTFMGSPRRGINKNRSSSTFSMKAPTRSSFDLLEMKDKLNSIPVVPSSIILRYTNSIAQYLNNMKNIRRLCDKNDLIPLYHYTRESIVPLILRSGFRMSTQGQGDGGVYFSTLGPASYGIGSPQYEENIIIDCFGKERLEEYLGKHKLDVCLVYAVDPLILEQAPGGRENALLVPKVYFEEFSLPNQNGSYYLRPDRIVGAFSISNLFPPEDRVTLKDRLHSEVMLDLTIQSKAKSILVEKRIEIMKKRFTSAVGNDYNEYDADEDDEDVDGGGKDDRDIAPSNEPRSGDEGDVESGGRRALSASNLDDDKQAEDRDINEEAYFTRSSIEMATL